MHLFTPLLLVGLLASRPGLAADEPDAIAPEAAVETVTGQGLWSQFTLGIALENESLCELCSDWKPAWAAFRRGAELVASPLAERIPTIEIKPWLTRSMASLAIGAARSVSDDPQSVDPIRFVSHDETAFVGVLTPSDQLRTLSSVDPQQDQ